MPKTLFNKVSDLRPKSLWLRCFHVNFAKIVRTPFFTGHLRTTASEFVEFERY